MSSDECVTYVSDSPGFRLQAPSVFTPRVSVKGTHQTRERFDNGGAAGTHVLGIRLFQETEAMRQ